jgi:hypothetical protein
MLWPLKPRKNPSILWIEAGWAQEQKRVKYFASSAIQTPDHSAHSKVAIPTILHFVTCNIILPSIPEFFPASCYFIHLRCKCSPQQFILINLQSMFFLQPSGTRIKCPMYSAKHPWCKQLPNTINVLGPTSGNIQFSQYHTVRLLKLSFGTKGFMWQTKFHTQA